MTATVSNIIDELDGLKDALTIATADIVIPDLTHNRTLTIINRENDGNWIGPWPLIQIAPFDWRLYRLEGGVTGTKGNTGQNASIYTITVLDVIDPRAPAGTLVADSQTLIYTLIDAIITYFDHLPNQLLKDGGGAPRATRCGEFHRWRFGTGTVEGDGGETRVAAAGTISVWGLVHPQQPT